MLSIFSSATSVENKLSLFHGARKRSPFYLCASVSLIQEIRLDRRSFGSTTASNPESAEAAESRLIVAGQIRDNISKEMDRAHNLALRLNACICVSVTYQLTLSEYKVYGHRTVSNERRNAGRKTTQHVCCLVKGKLHVVSHRVMTAEGLPVKRACKIYFKIYFLWLTSPACIWGLIAFFLTVSTEL